MKKEITFNEEKTEATVVLELTARKMARDPKMTVTTRMVKTMIENDNLTVDKCILCDTINNHNEYSKHSGKWIFSLLSKNNIENVIDSVTQENKKVSKKKKGTKKAS